MSTIPPKPLPNPLPIERPYWEHARAHRLAMQRCAACAKFRFPASPVCADCDSDRYEWTPVSGRGKVVSWVVFHRLYFPSFAGDLPYNVALIELEEGPIVVSNLVGIANDAIRRGLAVVVTFDDVNGEFSIPRFRPSP